MINVVKRLFEKDPQVTINELVKDPLALPPSPHQPQIPQDAQLVARRRGTHPHHLRQLSRREFP